MSDEPETYAEWLEKVKPSKTRGKKAILIVLNGKQHIVRHSLLSYFWIVWLAEMPCTDTRRFDISYEKASAPTAKGVVNFGEWVKVKDGTNITCALGDMA